MSNWNWTPKARAWWFNFKLIVALVAVYALFMYQILTSWGRG